MEAQNGAELPRWKCHKEVHAFKITGINIPTEQDGGYVTLSGDGISKAVSAEYMKKHRPQVGGYYVQYDDSYESFSPQQPFESGYSRIRPQFDSANPPGKIAYDAYFAACGGKSLISGAQLPAWSEQRSDIQDAWNAAARAARA